MQMNTIDATTTPVLSLANCLKPNLEVNLSSATLLAEGDNDTSSLYSSRKFSRLNSISQIVGDVNESSSTVLGTPSEQAPTTQSAFLPPLADSKNSLTSASPRHGISRYAPYGTRFAAQMKDSTFKMSHIAGDLAQRAYQKGGKGSKVDLVLVIHEGERCQLDSALKFYEISMTRMGPKPGPSEILNHLKDGNIDWDYRKGEGVKLLQRNASNFFKRMIEHARRVGHPLIELETPPVTPMKPTKTHRIDIETKQAAATLGNLTRDRTYSKSYDSMDIDSGEERADFEFADRLSTVWDEVIETSGTTNAPITPISPEGPIIKVETSRKRLIDLSIPRYQSGSFHYAVVRELVKSNQEIEDAFQIASAAFDWSTVESVTSCYKPGPKVKVPSYFDTDEELITVSPSKRRKLKHIAPKKTPTKPVASNNTPVSSVPTTPAVRKGREGLSGGFRLKGLSRHSPYGTRFCAQMPSGDLRESFLAGDLAQRVRSGDGKGQGELLLVLHKGEIEQLQTAWEFVAENASNNIGAGAVLEHLRVLGLDANHRKEGSLLLQKNAGNFFKRVQEYGKRKQHDMGYLAFTSQ